MKKKTIILIVGLTIVVGTIGILYYRYISSPEYSLGQIKKAYEQHDITAFEKYVDTKTLIGGILDKTLSEMSEKSTASSKAEKLGEDLGKGLINLIRPQVEELWTQQINKLIETGDIQGENGKKGLDELWNKNDMASFKGIKEVKKDGKVATISLEFTQPRFDTTLVLDIKMRDKGSYWQLFDISNIFDFNKTVEALEERRVKKLNDAVMAEFFKNGRLSPIEVINVRKGYYTVWYENQYLIGFENISNKEVEVVTCFFDIVDPNGRKLKSGYVNHRVNLAPGKVYKHKEQDFISDNKVEAKGLTTKVELVGLKFSDGSKIEWQDKWEDLGKKK